jgi:hypothetical protein
MLWFIIHIASFLTALLGSAEAEEASPRNTGERAVTALPAAGNSMRAASRRHTRRFRAELGSASPTSAMAKA